MIFQLMIRPKLLCCALYLIDVQLSRFLQMFCWVLQITTEAAVVNRKSFSESIPFCFFYLKMCTGQFLLSINRICFHFKSSFNGTLATIFASFSLNSCLHFFNIQDRLSKSMQLLNNVHVWIKFLPWMRIN